MSKRQLTNRQIEILTLYASGMSDKRIAYELRISVNTVKAHMRIAYLSLGASNRVSALILAGIDTSAQKPIDIPGFMG